jgi:hypothetical protein
MQASSRLSTTWLKVSASKRLQNLVLIMGKCFSSIFNAPRDDSDDDTSVKSG